MPALCSGAGSSLQSVGRTFLSAACERVGDIPVPPSDHAPRDEADPDSDESDLTDEPARETPHAPALYPGKTIVNAVPFPTSD